MSESSTISRHALTVLTGQLAVMAFGVTDTIVAGRHSDAALAALSVGSAIFISVYVALMGILQALMPVWAEQRGARNPGAIGKSLRQALYLCAVASAVGMFILLSPGPLLRWTEVPQALRTDVGRYLAVLALALPPALLFRIYSTLNQALHLPRLVTWLQLAGLALKVPLSMWWAWGGAGVTAQGATGCAWATLAVNGAMAALAGLMLSRQTVYHPYCLWQRPEPPDWQQLGQFLRLGLPAGMSILVEVTSFTLMALFIARLGTTAAASHQIAANLMAVLYMVPLSIAIATSARASYWLGGRQPAHARQAIRTGLLLALGLATLCSAALWLGHTELPKLYTQQAEVARQAAPLLVWVALYHLFDAAQTLCVFVLRCYRVTVVTLVVYGALLWGAGLGGGYWLAYRGLAGWAPWERPDAFWAGTTVALAAVAAIFMPLLWRAVHRPLTSPL